MRPIKRPKAPYVDIPTRPRVEQQEALLQVAEMMLTVKDESFDWGTFGEDEGCDTIACVAGWTVKLLPQLGLVKHDAVCLIPHYSACPAGHESLRMRFGLSRKATDLIFYPSYFVARKDRLMPIKAILTELTRHGADVRFKYRFNSALEAIRSIEASRKNNTR